MKMMLNGAVKIGTEDGDNAEIPQLEGDDNIHIFGERSAAVISHYAKHDYNSNSYYTNDNDIKEAVDFIVSPEMISIGQSENLQRLHHELCTKDWFMTLLDLKSYIAAKNSAVADYTDRLNWAKKSLTNIAKAGYFSRDRTIAAYTPNNW